RFRNADAVADLADGRPDIARLGTGPSLQNPGTRHVEREPELAADRLTRARQVAADLRLASIEPEESGLDASAGARVFVARIVRQSQRLTAAVESVVDTSTEVQRTRHPAERLDEEKERLRGEVFHLIRVECRSAFFAVMDRLTIAA